MSFKKHYFFSLIELSVFICLAVLIICSLFYSTQGSIQWITRYKSQNKNAYESRRFQSDINKLYFFSLDSPHQENQSLIFNSYSHYPDFFPSFDKKPISVELKIKKGRVLLSIKNQKSFERNYYYFDRVTNLQSQTTEETLEITLSFSNEKKLSYLFLKKDFFKLNAS